MNSRLQSTAKLTLLHATAACLWLLFSYQAYAHPFHLCVGQMKWNAAQKHWEVSIRLHPQDLEAAMSSALQDASGRRVSTDDKDFPDLALGYLSRNLYLRRTPKAMLRKELEAIVKLSLDNPTAKGLTPGNSNDHVSQSLTEERSRWTWVGTERERGWLWIHLELNPPQFDPAKEKLWMVNRLLMDHVERQENTMSVDPVSQPKYSLQFKKGEEVLELANPKKP
jgi:hypothetical protein